MTLLKTLLTTTVISTALFSTGCEMVDSQILEQVRQYFPQAEIIHPIPTAFVIRLHVGNVTEKFAEQVIAQIIRDHCCHGLQGIPQDLDFCLPAGGYTNLTINFDEAGCGWDPNNPRTLVCVSSGTQERHQYGLYDQLTFPPIILRQPVRHR